MAQEDQVALVGDGEGFDEVGAAAGGIDQRHVVITPGEGSRFLGGLDPR